MRHFVFRWIATTIAVMWQQRHSRNSVRFDRFAHRRGPTTWILNAFVRPVLLILSAPLILVTLGFFILIVNGLMLLLVPSVMAWLPC